MDWIKTSDEERDVCSLTERTLEDQTIPIVESTLEGLVNKNTGLALRVGIIAAKTSSYEYTLHGTSEIQRSVIDAAKSRK